MGLVLKDKNGKLLTRPMTYPATDEQVKTQLETLAEEGKVNTSPMLEFMQDFYLSYEYDEATNANYMFCRVNKSKINGGKQYPFVVAPNGNNVGTQSTYDFNLESGYCLAINAGIFDVNTLKPDGIVIENGEIINSNTAITNNGCKPLTIDINGNLSYCEANVTAETLLQNNIVSAVCGFMPIMIDFEAVPSSEWNNISHYTQNAQRQIIGQFDNGDYGILTSEGRNNVNSDGWTILEAQSICKKHGFKFAYNLDGGGSTETVLGKKMINHVYENATGRVVPTYIVFNSKTVL